MKIKTDKQFNGAQLIQELELEGIFVNGLLELENDILTIPTDYQDEAKIIAIFDKHKALDFSVSSAELAAKRLSILQKLGITEEEAKLLLS